MGLDITAFLLSAGAVAFSLYAFVAVNRPHMSIGSVAAAHEPERSRSGLDITITNVGKSPASDVHLAVEVLTVSDVRVDTPMVFDYDVGVVPPGQSATYPADMYEHAIDESTSQLFFIDPGAAPDVKPGSGAIDWKIKFNGDGLAMATDAAGNSATVGCNVPPPPK